ncbi:MAG: DUF3857 domain-containing protein [Chthoniobacter sp.]|nr:DUF3857 domain-containing protein [Chthoniobacter sp.]
MTPENLVSPSIRERVTVAPPAGWVVRHEEPVPAAALVGTNPILILDCQHHAERHESYERTACRLDTTQAVQNAAQWRRSFDPDAQELIIHALTVRRHGGAIEHARPDAVRLLQREEGLDHLVIDGWVTAVVLIEDVRVGDILDVSVTTRTKPRMLAGHFWLFASVPWEVNVHRFRVDVRFPSSETLRWKSSTAGFAPKIQEAEGETVWTWSLDEVLVEEMEPGIPTWHLAHRWLQVSSLTSWGQVAVGMAEAWTEQLDSAELTRVAEEIASSADTLTARGSQALTFVQDEIRYLSVNTGLGGSIPASPTTVLRRRFGDCKDKSFLAAHLLRRLGIPARPVLVSTGLRHTLETLLPMPLFDHAVVEYEIDGERRWADTTHSQQGGGALKLAVPDFRRGLPIGRDVADLENQPPPPETHDRYELHETFFLDTAHGASTLRVVVTGRGRDADVLRRRFARDGAESVARERLEHYRGAFPHLRRVGQLEWRDDRERNEFLVGETYDAERLLVQGTTPETVIFTFPAYLVRSLLAVPNVAKRRQPLAVPHPCTVEHRIEIESPAITRGEGHGGRSMGAPFQLTYATTQQPGRYSVRYSLRFTADCVPPDKFASYQKKVDEAMAWTIVNCTLPLGVAVPWSHRQHAQLLPRPRTPLPADPTAGRHSPELGEAVPALTSIAAQPSAMAEAPIRAAQKADIAADADPTDSSPAPREEEKPSSRRHRRRKQRKKSSREGFWIAVGVALILIAGLAVIFLVGLNESSPSPILSGEKPKASATPLPVALGRRDIPLVAPETQAPQSGEHSFFSSKPGPFSPNPATPPPALRSQLPGE